MCFVLRALCSALYSMFKIENITEGNSLFPVFDFPMWCINFSIALQYWTESAIARSSISLNLRLISQLIDFAFEHIEFTYVNIAAIFHSFFPKSNFVAHNSNGELQFIKFSKLSSE